jgi:hypothetical protein
MDSHQISQKISPHPVFFPSFPRNDWNTRVTVSPPFPDISSISPFYNNASWNHNEIPSKVTMKSPCSGARKTWNPHQITLKSPLNHHWIPLNHP